MYKEMGQKFHGGHAEYASVKAEWLVPLPETLAPIDAMDHWHLGVLNMVQKLAQLTAYKLLSMASHMCLEPPSLQCLSS